MSVAGRVWADSGSNVEAARTATEVAVSAVLGIVGGNTEPFAVVSEDWSDGCSFRAKGVWLPRPHIGGSVCPSTVSSPVVAIQLWW